MDLIIILIEDICLISFCSYSSKNMIILLIALNGFASELGSDDNNGGLEYDNFQLYNISHVGVLLKCNSEFFFYNNNNNNS